MTPLHAAVICIAVFLLGVLLAVGGAVFALLYGMADPTDNTPGWCLPTTMIGAGLLLTSTFLLFPLTAVWWFARNLPN